MGALGENTDPSETEVQGRKEKGEGWCPKEKQDKK